MKIPIAAALFLLVTANTVLAQGTDIPVQSGAVGQDERAAMMAQYGLYNLHLAFARSNGEFLGDVKVAIRSRNGSLVYEGTSDGPLFFARLASGTYEVTAESEGSVQKHTVTAGAANRPMTYFRWN